ncbi:MAG TPA: YceI family protein [Geminicoccus sp.]|jgi:polyisoprenoid-binding protein YceI|uniref:YceI family protein n=1 Tax=Geminicoccus sp. TaxID=2024832 RepID=UPI002E2EB11E|nr:YceI family protein [Geminicoccus sp.]HEX2528390.1 YceI family protein [Geminicoccus sp.]
MFLRAFAVLLLVSALMGSPAQAKDWVVDPASSKLTLTFQQGQTPVTASFERFATNVRFDPAFLADALVEVKVDLTSFTSGDAQRDAQAQGADFLDAGGAAEAVYRATTFEPLGGDRYKVAAELALKGVTRQIVHEATIKVDGDRAYAEGTVPVTRTDFGVGTGQFATGSLVGLDVNVAFVIDAKAG